MIQDIETLKALLVRGRETLAKLEHVAARPTFSAERKDRLSDLIGQQTELIQRMENSLRFRELNPGKPT